MRPFSVFPNYFSFDHFWPLPIVFRKKNNFIIRFYIKFHVKPDKCLPAFFQKLKKKTVRVLGVNETNLLPEMLLVSLFYIRK